MKKIIGLLLCAVFMVVLLGACTPKDEYADKVKSWRVKELRQLAFKHGKPSKDSTFLGYLSKEENMSFYLLALDRKNSKIPGKVFVAADKNSVCTLFGYLAPHYSGKLVPLTTAFFDNYELFGRKFCDVYVQTGHRILEDDEAEKFADGVLNNLKTSLGVK